MRANDKTEIIIEVLILIRYVCQLVSIHREQHEGNKFSERESSKQSSKHALRKSITYDS